MASWDDEDYEPVDASAAVTAADKWDGEDEDDDDCKDNWDDEDEETPKSDVPKSQPKKKKTLAEKIAEKEEKKRQEAIERQQQLEAERDETPEEELERKMREQRLQEESDLELAKEAFGVVDVLPGVKTIDNFMPSNKEEFTELSNMIVQKLAKLEVRMEYASFLETLVRDCCAGCEAEEIKKISNTLNLLVQEKQKLNKAKDKGKKKTATAAKKTLASGKGMNNDQMDYYDDGYNEYEDFM